VLVIEKYLTANETFICILDIQDSESKVYTAKAYGVEVEM
jgi:hypothetical protein